VKRYFYRHVTRNFDHFLFDKSCQPEVVLYDYGFIFIRIKVERYFMVNLPQMNVDVDVKFRPPATRQVAALPHMIWQFGATKNPQ
jgi:hypothetical protein